MKSIIEAMQIDSSFAEPNAWIMDTKNHRWHNLHLVVDGECQWCNLILTTQLSTTITSGVIATTLAIVDA